MDFIFQDAKFFICKSRRQTYLKSALKHNCWYMPEKFERKIVQEYKKCRNVFVVIACEENNEYRAFGRIAGLPMSNSKFTALSRLRSPSFESDYKDHFYFGSNSSHDFLANAFFTPVDWISS